MQLVGTLEVQPGQRGSDEQSLRNALSLQVYACAHCLSPIWDIVEN